CHPSSARSRGVGQQCRLAGVLHSRGDVTLMTRAAAGDAAGADLPAVGNVLPQQRRVLVVDVLDLVLTEGADLLLRLALSLLGHRGALPSKSPGACWHGNPGWLWVGV